MHKLIGYREIDLIELIKKDIFNENDSVVISSLTLLSKLSATDMKVQLQSLFSNSSDNLKIKVLDFIRQNPHEEYAELLENFYKTEKSEVIRLRLILSMGPVAKESVELLSFLRIRAGYEESRLDIRSQAIEALSQAQDFGFLLSLLDDFLKVEEDEQFACQILRCLKGLRDEEKFVAVFKYLSKLKDPMSELSVCMHEALFNLYKPGVKSQSQYSKLCEALVSMSRSSDDKEHAFVLKIFHLLNEGHETVTVKIMNSLLLTSNDSSDLKKQRRKLISQKIIKLCSYEENRKTVMNLVERLLLSSRQTMEKALKNFSLKVGENPKLDFIEFFSSIGNSSLLSVVIQYLKKNPAEEQRRNLILSIIKKIKSSLNARQSDLLVSVVKLLMTEDIRTRSALAIECGKIKFEDSLVNLTDNVSFLISVAPNVLDSRCEKVLIPIYEPISKLCSDGSLKLNLLDALVRSGSSECLKFVFSKQYDLTPEQYKSLFLSIPKEIKIEAIDFLKKKFETKRIYTQSYIEIVISLLERVNVLHDSEWIRILFQLQKFRFGPLDEPSLDRILELLLKSGSSAALDAFNQELKDQNYILDPVKTDFILSSYYGYLLDENEYNKETLTDLIYGCLKDQNGVFMAELAYVLHGTGENQGSVLLQQCLDSHNEDVVAKAIKYLRKAELFSTWMHLFKVLDQDSYKIHKQFLNFFTAANCDVTASDLKNELYYQLTGQRLTEEVEVQNILTNEEGERIEELFNQMRSSRMDNKMRYQMDQSMRELTIFFIDIAGYTKRSQEADIAEIMLLLDNFSKIIQPIGEQFNGNLIKKIGDCFMYTFDEPLEGVLASLEIQKQLGTYNAKRVESEQLNTRIGLNTGKVFVRDDDIFGDPVNLASRIESQAPPNGILIHESTFQGVDGFVEARKMDLVSVKGVSEPVQTYLILNSLPGVVEAYFKNKSDD